MKKQILFTFILLFVLANIAPAYEYHLQFTVPPNARGVNIAGYEFAGNTVVGNCSYYTVSACSGRGCHPTTTYYYNTCTWDLYGNLLATASGAPTAPAPLYQSGTEVVYASSDVSNDCAPNRLRRPVMTLEISALWTARLRTIRGRLRTVLMP